MEMIHRNDRKWQNMSDWILQKGIAMVYKRYTKLDWFMCQYKAFLVHIWYLYTKIYGANGIWFGTWPWMTIFYWYATGIWHHVIHMLNFFAVFVWTIILSNTKISRTWAKSGWRGMVERKINSSNSSVSIPPFSLDSKLYCVSKFPCASFA